MQSGDIQKKSESMPIKDFEFEADKVIAKRDDHDLDNILRDSSVQKSSKEKASQQSNVSKKTSSKRASKEMNLAMMKVGT